MYILKDKDDNIISCAKELSSIEDAKTIMNLPYGVIVELDEANGEGVILDEGRFYLKSQWEEIIKSDEYKYKKAKKEAFDEISVLKEELSNEDNKIIKIMEAKLKNEALPYNTDELLAERNTRRKRINELEHLFF